MSDTLVDKLFESTFSQHVINFGEGLTSWGSLAHPYGSLQGADNYLEKAGMVTGYAIKYASLVGSAVYLLNEVCR